MVTSTASGLPMSMVGIVALCAAPSTRRVPVRPRRSRRSVCPLSREVRMFPDAADLRRRACKAFHRRRRAAHLRALRAVPVRLPDLRRAGDRGRLASRPHPSHASARGGASRAVAGGRPAPGPMPRVSRLRDRVPVGRALRAARPFVERHRPLPARAARRALAGALTVPWLRRALFAPARLVAGRGWTNRWLAFAAAVPRRRRRGRLPTLIEPEGPARGTAVLLTGCVADDLFGDTNHATAALLRRAGVRVIVPRQQGCCGALPLHLGARDRAGALAAALAPILASSGADWVVSNAAGCGALLREYDHLLPGDEAAAAVARRTRDALELLAEVGLPAAPGTLARTVAVHDPCHLAHGQGVRTQVRSLLASIPGVRLVELDDADTCCGSAGTYNLTEPAMARRLLERKLATVAASGADVVAAANPGCLLQMRAGAASRGMAVEIEHPVDLLARAHGV